MKKLFITLAVLSAVPSGATTRLSIVDFEDKANRSSCRYDGWDWWRENLGSAFKEMLMAELKKHPQFSILERAKLQQLYANEHELLNSEHTPKKRKGHFQVADYAVAGVVSEFEYCANSLGGGVDVGRLIGFGSIKLGADKGEAKTVVDVRIIDVETGEVIATVTTEGRARESSANLEIDVGRLGLDLGGQSKTPLAAAAREAIKNAVQALVGRIPVSQKTVSN